MTDTISKSLCKLEFTEENILLLNIFMKEINKNKNFFSVLFNLGTNFMKILILDLMNCAVIVSNSNENVTVFKGKLWDYELFNVYESPMQIYNIDFSNVSLKNKPLSNSNLIRSISLNTNLTSLNSLIKEYNSLNNSYFGQISMFFKHGGYAKKVLQYFSHIVLFKKIHGWVKFTCDEQDINISRFISNRNKKISICQSNYNEPAFNLDVTDHHCDVCEFGLNNNIMTNSLSNVENVYLKFGSRVIMINDKKTKKNSPY